MEKPLPYLQRSGYWAIVHGKLADGGHHNKQWFDKHPLGCGCQSCQAFEAATTR